MNGISRPIVGREHELALLHAPGTARLVEIVGDPGIGKTSLLGEFARDRGAVFSGRATEFEQHVPFAVFLDALADRVAVLDAAERDRLGEPAVELLTTVFHGGAVVHAELQGVGRHRLYRAVRTLLEVVTPLSGGTVLLDDMHWADEGSVGLLEFLVRHPPTGPFLLAVSYRPRQASERLFAALSHAAGPERLRLDLKPLTLNDVRQLLPDVDPARAKQLHDSSGGNPFYLDALTRADGGGDPEVALSAELAALTPRMLLVAQSAALAGDPFDPELVAEVAELAESETLADLDELVARDLIRAENSARRFRYRHPLVRSAAYRTGRPAWRLNAHARAAAGLERRGAPATSRAHHVERAARAGDDSAITVLVEAAESVLGTVPALAVDWLHTAIDLLPRTPARRPQLCGLMLLRARALLVTGRIGECRDTLQDLLVLLPAEPSEQRSAAVSMCGTVERLLGRYDEAQALLMTELARLPDRHGRPAVRMRIDIAAGLLQCAKFEDARTWVTQALESPAMHEIRPLTMTIGLSILATADAYTGRFDTAVAHVRQAAAMLDGLSDGELAERLYLTLEVAWAELVLERNFDALRHVRRCAALAERTGNSHLQPDILLTYTQVHAQLGELAQAAEQAEATLEAALLMGRPNCWRSSTPDSRRSPCGVAMSRPRCSSPNKPWRRRCRARTGGPARAPRCWPPLGWPTVIRGAACGSCGVAAIPRSSGTRRRCAGSGSTNSCGPRSRSETSRPPWTGAGGPSSPSPTVTCPAGPHRPGSLRRGPTSPPRTRQPRPQPRSGPPTTSPRYTFPSTKARPGTCWAPRWPNSAAVTTPSSISAGPRSCSPTPAPPACTPPSSTSSGSSGPAGSRGTAARCRSGRGRSPSWSSTATPTGRSPPSWS